MLFEKILNYHKRNGTSAVLKKILGRILENLGLKARPAYEQVQNEFVEKITQYLKCEIIELKSVYIIGAHKARELPVLKRSFPMAKFYLFEPYPQYFKYLLKKFGKDNHVKIYQVALSDSSKKTKFYQTNIDGSGSLQKPNSIAKETYNMSVKEIISVEVDTLADFRKNRYLPYPDILWIDVQGTEYKVLLGASKDVLSKTKAIFVEVSSNKPIYEKQVSLNKIYSLLDKHGFALVGLGTDPINHTGNAIFIRRNA